MAPITKSNPLFILTITIFITHSTTTTKANSINLHQDKQSHLHFYLHDIVSGPNPTAVRVAAAPNTTNSPTTFGAVAVFDDPLTEGPDAQSKLIGRAQGMYMFASEEEVGLLMVVNLVFFEGGGGGSVAVVGRNAVKEGVREMAVVGGSGAYQFARGYVLVSTYSLDGVTGETVDEFDVYIEHETGSLPQGIQSNKGEPLVAIHQNVFVSSLIFCVAWLLLRNGVYI